jgi:outer membrane protein
MEFTFSRSLLSLVKRVQNRHPWFPGEREGEAKEAAPEPDPGTEKQESPPFFRAPELSRETARMLQATTLNRFSLKGKKMTRVRLVVLMTAVFFTLAVVPGIAFAEGKVGYINLQKLVNGSELGKNARLDIQKLQKAKQDAAAEKQRQVKQLEDLLKQKGDSMPADEKRQKLEALQTAYKDLKRAVEDANEEIKREDRELVAIILKKADGVLKKVAKEQGYTIILKDPNALGYLDPSVDITDLVLKELDKQR